MRIIQFKILKSFFMFYFMDIFVQNEDIKSFKTIYADVLND